jgi:hypothetical protein
MTELTLDRKWQCRDCGQFELRLDPCTGETTCVNCGRTVVPHSKKATPNHILSWVFTRKVLSTVAGTIGGYDSLEAADALATLIGELEAMQRGEIDHDIWRQACEGRDDGRLYGLERIGLWKAPE